MPDSQNCAGWSGSKTTAEMRLVITADPCVVPSACPVAPLSLLAQSPFCATPVMITFSSGFAATYGTFPHSDDIPARFDVAFTQTPSGSVFGSGPGSGGGRVDRGASGVAS